MNSAGRETSLLLPGSGRDVDSLNIDRAISRIHIGGQDDQKF
jgi:hypothetical protein